MDDTQFSGPASVSPVDLRAVRSQILARRGALSFLATVLAASLLVILCIGAPPLRVAAERSVGEAGCKASMSGLASTKARPATEGDVLGRLR